MDIPNTINDLDTLRDYFGEPSDIVKRKALTRLDRHCRKIIELSPFLIVASSNAQGYLDASPRGDAAGFVTVLDDFTLLIPDRPGNRRIDTLRNIVENPHIGLIFLVPGMNETLRVNGIARITVDSDLLAPLAVRGKSPRAGIAVTVEEAFFHCAKALIRSRLWDPDKHIERKALPTLGQILADQIAGVDADQAEQLVQDSYRKRLY